MFYWTITNCRLVIAVFKYYLLFVSIACCCWAFLRLLDLLQNFRKQLVSMINNSDSPYIRGIGFMYIRFCQPPQDLWAWMEPYLVSISNQFTLKYSFYNETDFFWFAFANVYFLISIMACLDTMSCWESNDLSRDAFFSWNAMLIILSFFRTMRSKSIHVLVVGMWW